MLDDQLASIPETEEVSRIFGTSNFEMGEIQANQNACNPS